MARLIMLYGHKHRLHEVHATRSWVFCVIFSRSLFVRLCLLAIVCSSIYGPFDNFKLFIYLNVQSFRQQSDGQHVLQISMWDGLSVGKLKFWYVRMSQMIIWYMMNWDNEEHLLYTSYLILMMIMVLSQNYSQNFKLSGFQIFRFWG